MITVIFTCHKRPALTELCLRRLIELMPSPYELFICYDGYDYSYMGMLQRATEEAKHVDIITNPTKRNRFGLINQALKLATGDMFMHVENDFYWADPTCLDATLNAFHRYPELDYIRFEHLPFTQRNFNHYEQVDGKDICWMREDSPYRFTFNPHIRRFKYPNDEPFKTGGFTKQPEQHHNDDYKYQSACMTGDNWRHLGIYSEGGHYKPYYGERFFNVKGKTAQYGDEYWVEFMKLTHNPLYLDLFMRYLHDNGN